MDLKPHRGSKISGFYAISHRSSKVVNCAFLVPRVSSRAARAAVDAQGCMLTACKKAEMREKMGVAQRGEKQQHLIKEQMHIIYLYSLSKANSSAHMPSVTGVGHMGQNPKFEF